jgi:TetR/AcrR family transcriptional regulator, cholesterol catabolism regulator
MNREQILESAAQLIREKGFHAASMQDIADAVNLQKASLYHHFSSKQEILLALLDQALDLLIERITAVLSLKTPSDEKLRLAMQVYLGSLDEYAALAAVLLLEHRSLDPEYHDRHIPRRDRFERLWRDLIQEGVANGFFQAVDPSMTARALLGVMNWTITWYRPDGKLSIQQISDQFAALFLDGLRINDPLVVQLAASKSSQPAPMNL